jgi:hypothetical protein
MTYEIIIDECAQIDIEKFYTYLRRYSKATAEKYREAFYDSIERTIAMFPYAFPIFVEVGTPYRAFLFIISPRTAFWIIYTIDDKKNEVRILRFWNTAREPNMHRLQ